MSKLPSVNYLSTYAKTIRQHYTATQMPPLATASADERLHLCSSVKATLFRQPDDEGVKTYEKFTLLSQLSVTLIKFIASFFPLSGILPFRSNVQREVSEPVSSNKEADIKKLVSKSLHIPCILAVVLSTSPE